MIYHHGDTEPRRKLIHEDLTERVMGAAIEVHRELGPGLMESAYEECLCHELHLRVTYLKMTPKRVGLILNFNVAVLARGGIVRKVL
jgi:hypothetical protein